MLSPSTKVAACAGAAATDRRPRAVSAQLIARRFTVGRTLRGRPFSRKNSVKKQERNHGISVPERGPAGAICAGKTGVSARSCRHAPRAAAPRLPGFILNRRAGGALSRRAAEHAVLEEHTERRGAGRAA